MKSKNTLAAVAIFTTAATLFFVQINTAQAENMFSMFCGAVRNGWATGPQAASCPVPSAGNSNVGGVSIVPGSGTTQCTSTQVLTTLGCIDQGTSATGTTPSASTSTANPNPIQITCPTGSQLNTAGTACVNIVCPTGTTLTNGSCVPTQTAPKAVASALPATKVNGGTTVTLVGSASQATTPGATITGYSWTQTAEPFVNLNPNANTANPSFVAPNFATTLSLQFALVVKDSNGLTSTPATVTVTVTGAGTNSTNNAAITTNQNQNQQPNCPVGAIPAGGGCVPG